MDIYVCIGSACHIKGSYAVLNGITNRVQAAGLEDKIIMKASFCVGECKQGVCVRVDDGPVQSVCPDNVDAFFDSTVRGAGLLPVGKLS